MTEYKLSRNELKTLKKISEGNVTLKNIACAINKSKAQTYRIYHKLQQKGFLEKEKSKLSLQKHSFIPILLNILKENPGIIPLLSDSGIAILINTLEPRTIKEIKMKSHLKKAIIYRKIKQARKFNIIKKEKEKYSFNKKIWPDLKEFLESYQKYIHRIDYSIGSDALIRGKYNKTLIVESNKKIKNSVSTAFSVYPKYNLNIMMPSKYHHIPKEKLNIKNVFYDSLLIIEDDKDFRKILYALLFYIKNKKKLKNINHELVFKFKEILNKKKIKGFPSLNEIKNKAKEYDIQI